MNNQDILQILQTAPNHKEMIVDNYSIDDLIHHLKIAHALYTTHGYIDMMLGHEQDANQIHESVDHIPINKGN